MLMKYLSILTSLTSITLRRCAEFIFRIRSCKKKSMFQGHWQLLNPYLASQGGEASNFRGGSCIVADIAAMFFRFVFCKQRT